MTQFINRMRIPKLFKVPARCKHGPNHWSVKQKKVTSQMKALDHFDDFYKKVYGKSWEDIRTALLSEETKYMAVINNFGDTSQVQTDLQAMGAVDLRSIYEVQKANQRERRASKKKSKSSGMSKFQSNVEDIIAATRSSEIKSLYPADYEGAPESITLGDAENEKKSNTKSIQKKSGPVKLQSIEENVQKDESEKSRIVHSQGVLSTSALYEFIPATKIKGLNDWVLESEHYSYYKKGSDFSAVVEKEHDLNFPEHLSVYTFEEDNYTRFPHPRKSITGVYNYYLLDGGSILPVLALNLQPGDSVLDMCAAPGGKSLAIIQTLTPRVIVSNDIQSSRVNRIINVMDQYLADMGQWNDRLFITESDARDIDDKGVFNKILVDVPCTTDRHVLHSDENNIFKSSRLQERLKLPEMQTDILTNALKLVPVGGTVVYSTCSLSPIQNDGVVQLALKKAWEEENVIMVVKDLSEALDPLNLLFTFGNFGLKYGHIVIPTMANNWGPMYFCKIVRVK